MRSNVEKIQITLMLCLKSYKELSQFGGPGLKNPSLKEQISGVVTTSLWPNTEEIARQIS